MACGASRCMNGPHWGLDKPLTQPPRVPQPCSSYQQAQARERLAGILAAQNLFSFLNNFSPHLCNVLAAVEPLFQLAFNLPNASSHKGDPKPCRTSRNAKHLQWVTAAEVPARTIPDLGRELGRRGQWQQLQSLCQSSRPRKECQWHWLEWG